MRARMAAAGCCASRIWIGRARFRVRRPASCAPSRHSAFEWDGEIVRQRERTEHYASALAQSASPRTDLRSVPAAACNSRMSCAIPAPAASARRRRGRRRPRACASSRAASIPRSHPGQLSARRRGRRRRCDSQAPRPGVRLSAWRWWSMMPPRASPTSCAAPISWTTPPVKSICSGPGPAAACLRACAGADRGRRRQTRQIAAQRAVGCRFGAAAAQVGLLPLGLAPPEGLAAPASRSMDLGHRAVGRQQRAEAIERSLTGQQTPE